MQLSAPATSTDLILATLAAPKLNADGLIPLGAAVSSAPGQNATPTDGPAPGFAQLFPDLASALPACTPAKGSTVGVAANASPSMPITSGISPLVSSMVAANVLPSMPVTVGTATATATEGLSTPPPATAPLEAGDPIVGVAISEKNFGPVGAPGKGAARGKTSVSGAPRAARHIATARAAKTDEVAVAGVSPDALPTVVPVPTTADEDAHSEDDTASVAEAAGDDAPTPRRDPVSTPTQLWSSVVALTPSASQPASAVPAESARATEPRANSRIALPSEDRALTASSHLESASPAVHGEPGKFPALPMQREQAPLTGASQPELQPTSPAQPSPVTIELPKLPQNPVVPAEIAAKVAVPAEVNAPLAVASASDALAATLPPPPPPVRGSFSPRRGGEEKIAAIVSEKIGEKNPPNVESPKTFLNAAEKEVTRAQSDLGIDVANSAPTMSALAFNHHSAPSTALSHAAPVPAMVASAEFAARTEALTAPDAPATAHRAVEAVLNAAERFSTGDRHAVNLNFSVGGADLAVRVELRADEVRATFRTDSPELRNALAHEWQAVATDSTERPFRLATPVITSNSSDAFSSSAFAGDGASQQRDANTRRTPSEVFTTAASRARGAASRAVDGIVSPAVRLGALPTSLHLHTLA